MLRHVKWNPIYCKITSLQCAERPFASTYLGMPWSNMETGAFVLRRSTAKLHQRSQQWNRRREFSTASIGMSQFWTCRVVSFGCLIQAIQGTVSEGGNYVTNKKSGGPLESRIIRSLHIQRAWKIWGGIGIVMLFQSYALINYLSQSLPETDMPKTAQEGIDFSGTRGLKIWKSDVGSATLPKNPESCSTTKNTI